jgi:hypothetical protein
MSAGDLIKKILPLFCVSIVFNACSDLGSDTDPEGNEPAELSFAVDVLPILQANCVACHSAGNSSGGLDLSNFSALMAGGNSGAGVVPENSAASLLVDRLTTDEVNIRMPLFGSPLSQESISLIEEWIDDGALDN